MKNNVSGKLEMCEILAEDSPYDKNLKAGWGRIDYNLYSCCSEAFLLKYCQVNLSKIKLKDGGTAHVEWDRAYTLTSNRGYGWGISVPTNTKVTGRWRYAE